MTVQAAVPGFPSIEEISAKFSGKGGTATDPAIPDQKASPEPEEPKPDVETAEGVEEDTPEVEAPAPEVKDVKEIAKKDPTSSRFAALSRREKELRARAADVEKREAAIAERTKADEERQSRVKAAKRPTDALKELGFSYADVTADVLGNYKEPEVDPMDAKLAPINERLAKLDEVEQRLTKWEADLVAKEQHQQIRQVNDEITKALTDDKYEITRAMGDDGLDLVKDVIVEYYKTHNKMLDYAEACDIVEQYYEEELVGKLKTTKKLKALFPEHAAPSKQRPPATPAKEPSPTLKNAHTSATKATVDIDKLPKAEALRELAKRLKFVEN